ncbi:MAG: mandelate racemase/muconate lactonizing enzyme family protein [Lachnospirales bacterium]
MFRLNQDFRPWIPVKEDQLQEIMDQPVVQTALLQEAVMIESYTLVKRDKDWFLIVRGTQGEEGITPCSSRAEYLYLLLERFLRITLGQDARNLEMILHQIYVTDINYKIQGLAYWCCISWIEAAILDMLARRAGVCVTELLGGRVRDELEMYVASGNRHTTPEEEVEILQVGVDRTGVEAIKFKLGGRMSRNADSLEGRTEGLLHLARRHFGDDFIIHVDGNGSFDATKGIEIGRIAESENVYFYEEPCPFDDLWSTKEVADALDVPLAFGEQETSLRRFAWIVENNAAQVLQPDLQYTGGFIQCIKVARMAAAAGMPVTPHVSGGFSSYNALIFGAVVPNIGHYHEYKGYGLLEKEGYLKIQNGKVAIPDGVGLGIDFSHWTKEGCQVVLQVK